MRLAVAYLVLVPILAGCIVNDDVVRLIGWSTEDGSIRVLPDETVTFWLGTSVATAEGAPGLDVSWQFGDGTNGTGNPVTHAYSKEGRYVVVAHWNEREVTHSLAVDFEKALVGNAPAQPVIPNQESRYDVHRFSAVDGARAIDIMIEANLAPHEALRLRLMGPDGAQILNEASDAGQIQVSTDTAPSGAYEIQIWVSDALQSKPVTGHVSVAY